MIKKIIGATAVALVLGSGTVAASSTPPDTNPAEQVSSSADDTHNNIPAEHTAASSNLSQVAANPTALTEIKNQCRSAVIENFHSDAEQPGAVDDPGHLAEKAAEAGQTLDAFIATYIDKMLIAATNDTPERLVVGDPWSGATAANDPPTEYGWVQGNMVACMFALSNITDEVEQQYYDTVDGAADWDGYHLRWFKTDPEDSDDGETTHFIVALWLSDSAAATATTLAAAAPTTAAVTTQPAPTTTQPAATTTLPAPTTTTPAATTSAPTGTAAPVDLPPAPAATLAIPTEGPVTPDMGVWAQQCLDGLMDACDDLYTATNDAQDNVIAGLEAWHDFADSCAGRQAMDTGTWCHERFASTNEAPPDPGATTTSGPEVSTDPQAFATVGEAHQVCVPDAVEQWFANRDKQVHPASSGGFQTEANGAGVSLNQFITDMLNGNYDAATDGTAIISPAQNMEEGSDLFSEIGLLSAQYFLCMRDALAIPDAVMDTYRNAQDAGSASWESFTLSWSVEQSTEGTQAFVVRITKVAA